MPKASAPMPANSIADERKSEIRAIVADELKTLQALHQEQIERLKDKHAREIAKLLDSVSAKRKGQF